MSSLPDPSRIPACKYLWRDAATDPRLVAVGAAARGLYFTVLAACDADGVLRHEGTVRAEQILAHYCGESLDDVKVWIARLVREGLLREELFGLAIPPEAFFRRQPQLRPGGAPTDDVPSLPLFAPVAPPWPDARTAPAARHTDARLAQVWIAGIEGEDLRPPRAPLHTVCRVRAPSGEARSSTERSDRRRYTRGAGRFRRRPEGMPFETWLVSTVEGRSLLAMRREVNPHYARGCTPAAVATGTTATAATQPATREVPLQPVAVVAPPHTPPLPEQLEGLASRPSHPSSECNGNGETSREAARQPATGHLDEVPLQRPITVADLDARREGTTQAARTVRAFLDAVNAPETVDGLTRGREVVVELGWGNKPAHAITLGHALLDAGATPGSSRFQGLVDVLRDQETFARIYARRKCVGTGKIAVSELVHSEAFALKQALAEVMTRTGVAPPTRIDPRRAQSIPRDPSLTGVGPVRATQVNVQQLLAGRVRA